MTRPDWSSHAPSTTPPSAPLVAEADAYSPIGVGTRGILDVGPVGPADVGTRLEAENEGGSGLRRELTEGPHADAVRHPPGEGGLGDLDLAVGVAALGADAPHGAVAAGAPEGAEGGAPAHARGRAEAPEGLGPEAPGAGGHPAHAEGGRDGTEGQGGPDGVARVVDPHEAPEDPALEGEPVGLEGGDLPVVTAVGRLEGDDVALGGGDPRLEGGEGGEDRVDAVPHVPLPLSDFAAEGGEARLEGGDLRLEGGGVAAAPGEGEGEARGLGPQLGDLVRDAGGLRGRLRDRDAGRGGGLRRPRGEGEGEGGGGESGGAGAHGELLVPALAGGGVKVRAPSPLVGSESRFEAVFLGRDISACSGGECTCDLPP